MVKTIQRALDFIGNFGAFILTSHENPDADGIGAELVLARLLSHLGKTVRILNSDRVPPKFAFLDPDQLVSAWDKKVHTGLAKNSGLIILDTSDELNMGIMADEALPIVKGALIIDHHEPSPLTKLSGYVDTDASSTAELILNILEAYHIPIDEKMAVSAYAGILYDTGSFIYPKTSASTFRKALMLVEAGAVPSEIYRAMFENSSVGALLLQKQVLSTLDIRAQGRIAIQLLRKEDLLTTGSDYDDAEALINIPLKSRDVEVSILIKENQDGLVRCSLRSKGKVNVSLIAQGFSGGGHRTAAGFKSPLPLAETKEEVLQRVITALEKA